MSEDISNIRKYTNTRTQVRNLIKEFNLSRNLSVPTETLDFLRQQVDLDGVIEVTDDFTTFAGKKPMERGFFLTFEPDLYKLQLWHKLNAPFSISIDSSLHQRNGIMNGIPLPIRGYDNGLIGSVQLATGFDGVDDWVDVSHDPTIEFYKVLDGFSFHIKFAPCTIDLSNGHPVTLYAKKDPADPFGRENAIISVIMPDGSINTKLTFKNHEYTVSCPNFFPLDQELGIDKWYDHTVRFNPINEQLDLLLDNVLCHDEWENPHLVPYPVHDLSWHIGRSTFTNRGLFWGGLGDFRFYWDLFLTNQHNFNLFKNRISISNIPYGHAAVVGHSYITHSVDVGVIGGFELPLIDGSGFIVSPHLLFKSEPFFNDLIPVYKIKTYPKVENDLELIYNIDYSVPVANNLAVVYDINGGTDVDATVTQDLLLSYDILTSGNTPPPIFPPIVCPNLFKYDPNTGTCVPVATTITCPTGKHYDEALQVCICNTTNIPDPPIIPPVTPPVQGQVDTNGILWHNATGTGGVIPQSRDESADDRWSENYTGLVQFGYECIAICSFEGTNSSSHMALKHWGSNHSGSGASEHRWYDTGIRVNGLVQLQWEGPHPDNHDFTLNSSQQFIDNIGIGMEGNTVGLKWQVFPVVPNGNALEGGMHLRMWCDTSGLNAQGRPQNNWRLVYDFIDHGTIIDPADYAPADDQEIEVRQSDTDSQEMYGGGVHFRRFTSADHSTLSATPQQTTNTLTTTLLDVGVTPFAEPTLYRYVLWGDNDTTQDAEDVLTQIMTEADIAQYLFLGDGPYSTSGDAWVSMMTSYFDATKKPKLMLSEGNHDDGESESQATEDDIEAWMPELSSPDNNMDWLVARKVGNVYIISMNTQDPAQRTVGGDQHTWVQARLNDAKALRASGQIDWIVVLAHKPAFCMLSSAQPEILYRNEYTAMWRDAQVDFIFHGHNHNNAIWRPVIPIAGNNANTAATALFSLTTDGKYNMAVNHGSMHAIFGNGGHEHNSFGVAATENVLFRNATDFGYGILEVQGKQARLISKSVSGNVLYTVDLTRGTDTVTQPPPTNPIPCTDQSPPPINQCPVGYHKNEFGQCVLDATTTCQQGYHKNEFGQCVPDVTVPPPATIPVQVMGFVGDTDGSTPQQIYASMDSKGVQRFGHMGDVSYSSSASTQLGYITSALGLATNDMVCSIGNHDHPNEDGSQGVLDAIASYFNLPTNTYAQSRQWQNVYVIAMNTQDADFDSNTSAQYSFVKSELEKATALKTQGSVNWIIVLIHKPFYIGSGNDHPADEEGGRSIYQTLFDQHQVDIVFHGHNHNIDVMKPLISGGVFQATVTNNIYDFTKAHGQIYATIGSGGRSRDSVSNAANSQFTSGSSYGYVLLTFNNTGLICQFQILSQTGAMLHEFQLSKQGTTNGGGGGGGGTTNPPPVTGEVDADGILWMEARGQKLIGEMSRDESTDDRWSFNVTGLRDFVEATFIGRSGSTSGDAHFAMKIFGGNHSGGDASSQRWYDLGIRENGDIQLQWEGPHPSNHDFTLPAGKQFITNIGTTLEGNWIGLKWLVQKLVANGSPENGGVRCRMWVDTDPINTTTNRPKNNWRLCFDFIDGIDVEVIDPQDYQAPDEQDCEVRRSDTGTHDIYGAGVIITGAGEGDAGLHVRRKA